MKIGVPYARKVVQGDSVYERCPVCEKLFPLKTDADGEAVGRSGYSQHYVDEHRDDVPSAPLPSG